MQFHYRKSRQLSADDVIIQLVALASSSFLFPEFSILQLRFPDSPGYSPCFLHLFSKLTHYFSLSFNLFLVINIWVTLWAYNNVSLIYIFSPKKSVTKGTHSQFPYAFFLLTPPLFSQENQGPAGRTHPASHVLKSRTNLCLVHAFWLDWMGWRNQHQIFHSCMSVFTVQLL